MLYRAHGISEIQGSGTRMTSIISMHSPQLIYTASRPAAAHARIRPKEKGEDYYYYVLNGKARTIFDYLAVWKDADL